MGMVGTTSAEETSCPADILSQPIYWDLDRLSTVKSEIKTSAYKESYAHLIRGADKALDKKPYTVTDKTKAGPSGDLKDYVSLSRYFWPNPKKKTGLPYIRKDGQTNPEINGENFDRRRSQHMTNDVTTLSLAAYFTGNKDYSDKAQSLVQAWFLDETTGMNPHLNYAQNVPGASEGREFGILDGRIYWDVIDSLLLLQSANIMRRGSSGLILARRREHVKIIMGLIMTRNSLMFSCLQGVVTLLQKLLRPAIIARRDKLIKPA